MRVVVVGAGFAGLAAADELSREHTAGGWHGLMEGALRSGFRAAQQLLQTAAR